MEPTGIDRVRSRIAHLRALTESRTGPAQSLGSTGQFAAFGDSYQAALAQRDGVGTTSVRSNGPVGLLDTSQTNAAASTPAGTTGTAVRTSTAVRTPVGGSGFPGVDAADVLEAIAGLAPAGVRPVGGYGSMPVPDALRDYGNGRIPEAALTPISQSGHRLYAPAAQSWNNVIEAARRDGIELRITDSYRSYEQQVDLARRKGLYSEGGLAARPGTSNHGWGLAVDVDVRDATTREWLQINGPRFGWIESVPREPWHWEFRPAQV